MNINWQPMSKTPPTGKKLVVYCTVSPKDRRPTGDRDYFYATTWYRGEPIYITDGLGGPHGTATHWAELTPPC